MSMETKMIAGGIGLASALHSAMVTGQANAAARRLAEIDQSGEEAVAILTAGLRREHARRLRTEAALAEAHEEIVMLRQMLRSRGVPA
ncbi:hypothetical protein SAMN06297251_10158 [Fulvimarina manganoxydans]|uniref:Uncharacterized protein n=1 Tax=Fulvimarina manganoxydans TaxID=937218 RepID=A0A1W1YA49_9HYPH|nr:hypothetical protein [Fulvimarina manganoxydans]SMC32628.1 hypothetical protein SAMN06297251_10158 [Fulvimarina manganoxydans]